MNADANPYPHLDPEPLRQLAQLARPEVVERMIETFCESTESRISHMTHAVTQGDTDSVRFEAHTLKSSSASVGALMLSNLCLNLEQHIDGPATSPQKVQSLSQQIEAEFQQLRQTFQRHGTQDFSD